MSVSQASPTIRPSELEERLSRSEPVTILDIREQAEWPVQAAGATLLHVPAERALADPAGLAAGLEGPVAVVCARGVKALAVASALRAEGADAASLEGGMQGWISTLRAWPVDLGIEGLELLQVQRPGRGCLSYLLAAGGEAVVVDPAPDPDFYLALARRAGARITHVFDTHIHADHLSGGRALAALAGASYHLPAPALERGVSFAAEVEPVADGDRLDLGAVSLRAVALPGHTTDMTGLLVGERALLSGDSLFADGIARPDLQRSDPEGARAMARTLHGTLRNRVLNRPDDLVVLPAHTHPGVQTGPVAPRLAAVRAAVPELAIEDPDEFAAALTAAMPARPANYEAVIAVNSGALELDPELEVGGNSCATR